MTNELKPCPFCLDGGELVIDYYDQRVICNGCACWMPIEAWNTRYERTCRIINGKCSNCGDKINAVDFAYCRCCGAKVVK